MRSKPVCAQKRAHERMNKTAGAWLHEPVGTGTRFLFHPGLFIAEGDWW